MKLFILTILLLCVYLVGILSTLLMVDYDINKEAAVVVIVGLLVISLILSIIINLMPSSTDLYLEEDDYYTPLDEETMNDLFNRSIERDGRLYLDD